MHSNNSELIASGLSVNFNWPPEECDGSFFFSLKFHLGDYYWNANLLSEVHHIPPEEGGKVFVVNACGSEALYVELDHNVTGNVLFE